MYTSQPMIGLHVAFAGFIEKICRSEEIAVIGDGHRRHLLPRSFVEKLAGFASPIQQTEISVNVQMNELRLPHGTQF
jgi:hypothetical protein